MKPIHKPLVIRDEIHGDMVFDGVLRQVIDHDCFQRLRYIKQLGLAEYVFPCATHTRFQHSLGASYLAGQYFESLVKGWVTSSFSIEEASGSTRFYPEQTIRCVQSVAEDAVSHPFWHRSVSLAGMLHDVGHGPWSHTFEFLDLNQDFTDVLGRLTGAIAQHYAAQRAAGIALKHEDISVLYIFHILHDLEMTGRVEGAMKFFLPVATLVNRKLTSGKFAKAIEGELQQELAASHIKGGAEMHRLLRPLISGPFDVDRIDYIQRDGRNCGVSIGGIEWRRIVTKLVPCLAEHHSSRTEPSEVVLLSNLKNQHVLDDFIFSLFQMYAQVYMHPKIVGVEETAKKLLAARSSLRKGMTVTFDLHRSLSDEKFRFLLKNDLGVPEIEDILLRRPSASFQVATVGDEPNAERQLKESGFGLVDTLDRPMMKDSMGVYLFSSHRDLMETTGDSKYFVRPWSEVSPIARQFYTINYSPRIWIRSEVTQ